MNKNRLLLALLAIALGTNTASAASTYTFRTAVPGMQPATTGAPTAPAAKWSLLSTPATQFGTTKVGNKASTVNTVTLLNIGTAAGAPKIGTLGGANPEDFTVTNCQPVASDALCNIQVSFSPTAVGTRSATLSLETGNVSYTGLAIANTVTAVDYLVVAGGGGGGNDEGGGGGGGGVLYGTNFAVTPGSYTITVGKGGTPQAYNVEPSVGTGGNSSFASFIAKGGGGGAGWNRNVTSKVGANGGSGGGTWASYGVSSGTSGQGFAGGSGLLLDNSYSETIGGGGGAGGVGLSGTSTTSGAGGVGRSISITGVAQYYGGGGGAAGPFRGTAAAKYGVGGLGGGGAGGIPIAGQLNGQSGTPNTGGGGGGSADLGLNSQAGTAGSGGSGIVVIRYQGNPAATGGTVTTSGGYTVHTFLTSGTLTIQ